MQAIVMSDHIVLTVLLRKHYINSRILKNKRKLCFHCSLLLFMFEYYCAHERKQAFLLYTIFDIKCHQIKLEILIGIVIYFAIKKNDKI